MRRVSEPLSAVGRFAVPGTSAGALTLTNESPRPGSGSLPAPLLSLMPDRPPSDRGDLRFHDLSLLLNLSDTESLVFCGDLP